MSWRSGLCTIDALTCTAVPDVVVSLTPTVLPARAPGGVQPGQQQVPPCYSPSLFPRPARVTPVTRLRRRRPVEGQKAASRDEVPELRELGRGSAQEAVLAPHAGVPLQHRAGLGRDESAGGHVPGVQPLLDVG